MLSNEPAVARFLSPDVLARINSLELVARTVVEGFISGLHRSPFLGFSTDFAEHRQYLPGDEVRHIDWKLLARTDRLYIKKYQGDTNTKIHLLIDVSGSMGYGSGAVTKFGYAQYLAASLAYLCVRQHDSVGLAAFNDRLIEYVPPQTRAGHFRTLLGTIERLEPANETALTTFIDRTAGTLNRRGFVVLISDLYDDPEAIVKGLEHLRFRGHEVVVFHVLDRQELEFEFREPVVLEDFESEEQLHVMPDVLRAEYQRAINEHIDALRQGCIRNRIDYEVLNTSEPLDSALYSYLARRALYA